MDQQETIPSIEQTTDRLADLTQAPLAPSDTAAVQIVPSMIFRSLAMHRLWSAMQVVARRETVVMIHGETGTGKELVARQVHTFSNRAARPFVPVDCAALQDGGAESQLFGHVKNAFPGANHATVGLLRSAHTGTLYLDEIGDLPLELQAKLLHALQERQATPIGGVKASPLDIRIIASTHRNLEAMVQRGTFNEALFYWLNVVQLRVPPLRERADDIVPLAEHFLARLAQLFNEPVKTISLEAAAALQSFDWPYNIRELINVIETAHLTCAGERITPADLPEKVILAAPTPSPARELSVVPLRVAERNQIAHALRVAEGNQSMAARLLKIQRQRLYRKIQAFGLESLTRAAVRQESISAEST